MMKARRFLVIFLALSMLISLVSANFAFAVGEETALSGKGTKTEPYLISDTAAFVAFRDSVNIGETYEGKFVKLTADIDISAAIANGGSANMSWTPIGDHDTPFKGSFDGNGHRITGLYINGISAYQGLFGCVGSEGAIQNLCVDGTVKGGAQVGGIVGANLYGTIQNCCYTGSVTGSDYVGGVVGENYGVAALCYNAGTVKAGSYTGGVVGRNEGGTVTNCYNTGEVTVSSGLSGGVIGYVGGVVGYNYGTIENCYSAGAVTGEQYAGGVAGNHWGRHHYKLLLPKRHG